MSRAEQTRSTDRAEGLATHSSVASSTRCFRAGGVRRESSCCRAVGFEIQTSVRNGSFVSQPVLSVTAGSRDRQM